MFFSIVLVVGCRSNKQPVLSFDVVVVGGGASGSMAGIQSARLGSATLIIEETPWLGGMLTSAGVSAIDGNYRLHSGLWQEFREQLYQHYGGEDSVKTGWVSNVLFEPNVGAQILQSMAAQESGLEIWVESVARSLDFVDGAWEMMVVKNGVEQKIKAHVVIDGTELGDISKMVGIPYDIGMDSRFETNEEIAPEQANDIIQDLTYVAILEDYGDEPRLLEKPLGYDPSLFYCTCAGKCDQDTIQRKLWDCEQMMRYGKLPNDKYMINWPIYGNDYYVNAIELDGAQRQRAFDEAKWFTKCYVYYLQNELGFRHLGIADDVFPSKDGFPLFPYHRESRRIKGLVQFDINDLARPFAQRDALYRTGIAVGDYPVDHHHEAYQESEKLPDLHFYPVPSYSLPLGTLIPKSTANFIVAEKSISVTNLVNGTTRLQPVCLLIGQAAGTLAHLSSTSGKTPGQVAVREVQDILLESGAYIMPYSDVSPADKCFNAIQRIGATGILRGEGKNIGWENHTLFYPDSVLTLAAIAKGLNEYQEDLKVPYREVPVTLSEVVDLLNQMRGLSAKNSDIDEPAIIQILNKYDFVTPEFSKSLTRKQFAVLLDELVDPFHSKQIDHFGMFQN